MKKIIIITFFLALIFNTAVAERLSISSNQANIRSGPGSKNKILWKVEKYHPIETISKKGNWYHFKDFENDEGYVHKSVLSKTKTIITKNKLSNIRSGPGGKNKIIFTVEKGIPFKILKKKGKWLKIKHHDGDEGWIHKSLVW